MSYSHHPEKSIIDNLVFIIPDQFIFLCYKYINALFKMEYLKLSFFIS